MNSTWLGLCLLLCSAALPGCRQESARPDTVKVSGIVKFKGELLKSGRISFQPKVSAKSQEYARPATGVIRDGAYSLTSFPSGADGMIPGEYVVTVESFEKELTLEEINEGQKPKSLIPERYNKPNTSKLAATVPETGPASINFDLKP